MKAYELLSDESKWTKDTYARDKDGEPVFPSTDSSAVCFCAQGALCRVYGWLEIEELPKFKALREAVISMGFGDPGINPITEWNDAPERTFAEVRDLLIKLDI